MATTSPDTLWSPDPTGNYNLVADWATSMQSVQAALVKRANLYVGTSAQRTAFTTAPEGVHWQDTDGTKGYWAKRGTTWVSAVSDLGVSQIEKGGFSAGISFVTVTFPKPFPAGVTPRVTTQVNSGSSAAIGISSLVANVTNTGFISRVSTGGPFSVDYIAVA